MKNCVPAKVIFIFLFMLLMNGVIVRSESTSEECVEDGPSFMALPIIGYSTDTGFLAGAAAFKSYNRDRYRISTFAVTAIYTVKNQFISSVLVDHYFPDKRNRIYIYLSYMKYPTIFFGLGNNTSNDDPEKYTPEYFKTNFFYERRLKSHFRVKTGLFIHNQALIKYEPDGILVSPDVPMQKGRLDAGPELSLVWDSRDNTNASRTGSLLQATYRESVIHDRGSGFNELKLEARKFFNPLSRVVFAFMAEAVSLRGHAPFYMYPVLGGGNRLRGYEESRFRNRNLILFQHDIRFTVWGPFDGAVFAAAGRVGHDVESLFSGTYHSSYGCGPRWFFNREDNMAISMDFAWGSDSRGVYVYFGEAY